MKGFHIEFNGTASMPIGFYREVHAPMRVGNLVSVCLPMAVAKEGVERGYLSTGYCRGHAIAVLKKVIALPGDTVTVTTKGMQVGSHFYDAPVESRDHNGKRVKRFISNGTYHKTPDVWLYGSNDFLQSWDSRYYGGVSLDAIQGQYKPFLTF